MSAVVCGKRTLFEELTVSSPPVSKRIRCSSSPVRFSPRSHFSASTSAAAANLINQLSSIFPDMDKKLLERALEECGDDLDSAIKSLNELRLGSSAVTADVSLEANVNAQVTEAANGDPSSTEDPAARAHLPVNGTEWVDLFVREMMSSSNMDDARARVSTALEALEKTIRAQAGAEVAKSVHQENMMLKEQIEGLIQENAILKRAVSIQHDRQKEFEDKNQELQQLKQLVSQYQDQLRTLEVVEIKLIRIHPVMILSLFQAPNSMISFLMAFYLSQLFLTLSFYVMLLLQVNNYALTMHLKQAQQSSSIPGRFHPDVF